MRGRVGRGDDDVGGNGRPILNDNGIIIAVVVGVEHGGTVAGRDVVLHHIAVGQAAVHHVGEGAEHVGGVVGNHAGSGHWIGRPDVRRPRGRVVDVVSDPCRQRADVGFRRCPQNDGDGRAALGFRIHGIGGDALEGEVRLFRRRQDLHRVVAAAVVVPERVGHAVGDVLHADDIVQLAGREVAERIMVPSAAGGRPVGVDVHFHLGPIARGMVEAVNQIDLLVCEAGRAGFRVDVNGVSRRRAFGWISVGAARPEAGGCAAAAEHVGGIVHEIADVNLAALAANFRGTKCDFAVAVRPEAGRPEAVFLKFSVAFAGPDVAQVHFVVGGVDDDKGDFLVVPLGEGVDALAAAGAALLEAAAAQSAALVAQAVQPGNVAVKPAVLGPLAEHVAAGVAGLEALVEHAFALPVAVVGVVPGPVAAVVVAALIEHVLGAVEQQGHRRRHVQERHRRAHDGLGGRRIAAAVGAREPVHVVVVEERNHVVLAGAVHVEVAHLLTELMGGIAVAEDILHRLHHRELQRGVEAVAVGAPARQRPVVVAEQLAEHQKIVFPAPGGVVADVLRPVAAPVVRHVLDGVHAESVAVRRVNQVLERLGQNAPHLGIVRTQVVGSFELAQQLLREAVPAVDCAVIMKVVQIVEGGPVLVAAVPPAEGAVPIGPVRLVIVLVAGVDAVLVAHVVGRDVENDIHAPAVAVVNQVLQVGECAHCGVALEKVFGVILVVGRVVGVLALVILLHTGNPQRGDAHPLQIIELLTQAVPVAAVVIVAVVGVGLAIAGPRRLVARQTVHAVRGEAVGEQLVDVPVPPLLRTRRKGVGVIARSVPRIERVNVRLRAVPLRRNLLVGLRDWQRQHEKQQHQPRAQKSLNMLHNRAPFDGLQTRWGHLRTLAYNESIHTLIKTPPPVKRFCSGAKKKGEKGGGFGKRGQRSEIRKQPGNRTAI